MNSAWEAGDFGRARDSSKKAKTWSVVAIISHIIIVIAVVVVPIVSIALISAVGAAVSTGVSNNDYYYE